MRAGLLPQALLAGVLWQGGGREAEAAPEVVRKILQVRIAEVGRQNFYSAAAFQQIEGFAHPPAFQDMVYRDPPRPLRAVAGQAAPRGGQGVWVFSVT